MAYFNPEAEPYEEIQGPLKTASPDELKEFYQKMEQDDLQRKLSKRKSSSIWSRKSLRRISSNQSQQQQPAHIPSAASLHSPSTTSLARGPARSVDSHETSDSVPPMPSRNILPDTLRELPSWYRDDLFFTTRYTMHNPVGPRWYRNHHLLPPSGKGRPPTVFSPSFPPMSSSASRDRLDESSRMPGLSRSTSNSPLPSPTPNSSQSQLDNTGVAPRSRKTSQNAPDNVDLMDITDPYGTAWHHESPYDVGLSSSPVSFEESAANGPRSRRASMTVPPIRHKTVIPSPLSQSTSAVHLHTLADPIPGSDLPRKQSRRIGLFGRHTTPAPTTPVDEQLQSRGIRAPDPGPPSSFVTPKKEKRGSVLGRIAKRFSISRKPATVTGMEVIRQPSPVKREASPERQTPTASSPSTKRVPVPVAESLSSTQSALTASDPEQEERTAEANRNSSISLEAALSFSIGKLTIANPDPTSPENTPVQAQQSLPQGSSSRHERELTNGSMQLSSPQISLEFPEPGLGELRVANPSQTSSETVHQMPIMIQNEIPPPTPEKPKRRSDASSRSPEKRSRGSPEKPSRSSMSASRPMSGQSVASVSQRMSCDDERERDTPSADSRPLSPKLPPVPYPADYGPTPGPSNQLLAGVTADISPLSTSSMLANPPTPYTADALISDDTDSIPPPVPSKSPRDPSPGSIAVPVASRATETFKLVRSSSGNVYASGDTIRAAGEQWEVIESSNSLGKNKSQERRHPRAESDSDQRKSRSERKRRSDSQPSSAQTFPRADTNDRQRRSAIPEGLAASPEPKPKRERKSPSANKPQPAVPSRPLERNPSASARPISELAPTADMNMLKAREAWDMDRLWKARSLSGMEPHGMAAPFVAPSGDSPEEPPVIYGSSHTAFMVSTPFQQPGSTPIYHSMPSGPAPVIYPPGYASPDPLANRAPNPLPEPPRESPYQPPLKLAEYWGKHASVTTAH